MAAAQVLSTFICPVYGDFYSFPWKRGPHDNIMDFVEVSPIFEKVREKVFQGLLMQNGTKFPARACAVFQREDDSKFAEVRSSLLRMITQLLFTGRGQNDSQTLLDQLVGSANLRQILMSTAFASKDSILQAQAIQVLSLMLESVIDDPKMDNGALVIDVQKVYQVFEKSVSSDPLLSIMCCNLMK